MEAESASAQSGTVIDFMEPMTAVVRADQTASSAVDLLVHHPTPEDVSYVYVIDAGGRLVGVFGMRDLLLAKPSQLVSDIMVRDPVTLAPDLLLANAMGTVLKRHYSRYPVVDEGGMPLGQVRGWKLVERTVAEIGNQPGSMVGVDRHERVGTPLLEAFRMRHPWLQVNLLTAFMAAFVVSLFEDTIARVVALAAFLPVLAGQSGNTGCQALAITLRGMTLGELADYPVGRLLRKEILLGALNGAAVGVVAAIAMGGYALVSDAAQPAILALVVLLAMIGACIGSGIFGVLVPVTLRRFGADPAMASSIFLTTFTDILGMGLMLLLATVLLV
ncbi:MAG: magnesium transporter [Gammaproteobacteria bacterium]